MATAVAKMATVLWTVRNCFKKAYLSLKFYKILITNFLQEYDVASRLGLYLSST